MEYKSLLFCRIFKGCEYCLLYTSDTSLREEKFFLAESQETVQNTRELLQQQSREHVTEGNDINDKLVSSDGVEIEMVDSDDESYDPANPDTYGDYF